MNVVLSLGHTVTLIFMVNLSLYPCVTIIEDHSQSLETDKDIGMVSCSFVCLCCVMTPCFFLFVLQALPVSPFILKH